MPENRCSSCGAPLPAHALGGHCPRCLLLQGLEGEAPSPDPGPIDHTLDRPPQAGSVLETTGAPVGAVPHDLPRDTAFGEGPAPGDPEATRPVASTASSPAGASGDRTPDPADTEATTDGPMTARDLQCGTTIRYFGDYEIQKELGRGGMGVVYQARQVSLNRPVALKMIKAGVLADDAELRRFQNEAEAVALLDHAGILPIYEIGEYDGQRYFSMKLIDGGNLAEQLASFQDDLGAAVALVIEAADAIQHAHMRGILHRDLKPANILIDAQGRPHITDFGLAKLMESDVELTASGAIMGTPAYMSPEQAAGRRGAMTLATDVYGLGAILYALLTGKAPFGGDSVIETLDAVRSRPPERPTKRNAKVARDLELICLKCLEKNPADRYPTAGALADDLRHWTAGEPVSVRAAGAVERMAKWARRKPTLAAAYTLGLLALLLGGLGGAAVCQWRAAARARDIAATARDGEAKARAAAETARDGEATAREALARVEYGRTMEVALQEWHDGNAVTALDMLEHTRTDLRGWEWSYVNRLCHSDLLTLKGHTSYVMSASFSPDGARIVTAGLYDNTAKVWDAKSGAELLTLKGHTGAVYSAAFSPDGSRVVTSSLDRAVKVWDVTSGAVIVRLKGLTRFVKSVSFSPDGSRVVGNWEQSAKVWDAKSGAELLTLKGHTAEVSSASISPDGLRIVTASNDKTAKVWDAKNGAELLTLKGHTSGVTSASFSPDGSRIVTTSLDGTARIWDAKSGADLLTLKGHFLWVHSASFSPDGSRLVTCGQDGTAKVWDSAPFKEYKPVLVDAQSSYDQKRFATAARLWAEALAGDPELQKEGWNAYRGKSARAAALAAAGQGDDAASLDDATRAKLRRQALDGLSAELSDWTDHIESAPRHARLAIVNALAEWRTDDALAGIRDAAPLAKLPADEQKDWRALWARVPMPESTTAVPPLNDKSLASEQRVDHEILVSLTSAAKQAWFGQLKEYSLTCNRVLEVAKNAKNPVHAECAAKICSLRPSDAKTHKAALDLAQRAVELGKGDELMFYFQMALGMAEYRCGHYAEADVALLVAAQLGAQNCHVSGTTAFYRAMSLFRQGKEAEARKLASEAAARMRPLPADEKNPLTGDANADDLILWMAFKEANALFGSTR